MTLEDNAIACKLRADVDTHTEERRQQFVVGFARFVIDRGSGALAPTQDKGKPESWQAVGRRLYGTELFNETLQRELAARQEQAHAESAIPPVRGDQGEDAGTGQTPGRGKDLRGKDHKQPRRRGPATPAPST